MWPTGKFVGHGSIKGIFISLSVCFVSEYVLCQKYPGVEPGPVRPAGRPHPPLNRHGRPLAALASPFSVSAGLQVVIRDKVGLHPFTLKDLN